MKKLLKLVFLLGLSFHSYGQIDDQEVKIAKLSYDEDFALTYFSF